MVYSCSTPGCKFKPSKTAKGLAVHERKCARAETAQLLLQRRTNRVAQASTAASTRGFIGTPAASVEPPEAIPSDDGLTGPYDEPMALDEVPEVAPDESMSSGRPKRVRKFPRAYKDFLPSSTTPLPHIPDHMTQRELREQAQRDQPAPEPPSPSPEPPRTPPIAVAVVTEPNEFGVYRSYPTWPSADPEENIALGDLCEAPGLASANAAAADKIASGVTLEPESSWGPFLSATVFKLMSWFYSGSNTKSVTELDRLVTEVLLQDDFDKEALKGFKAARETDRLDNYEEARESVSFLTAKGWEPSTVKIRLPCEKAEHLSEDHAPEFSIPGVFTRNIVEVITAAFQEPAALDFHMTPFTQYFRPSEDAEPVRMHGEMYTSDAMLEAHAEIQALPAEPGPPLECVVAAVMLWSDSTHLANFGTSALWPAYLFLGNQSKYTRAKPTAFAAHHLAYFPSLPDSIYDVYEAIFGKGPSSAVLTHCKRELFHAVWELLLNPAFMHAYEHGIVILCADGVTRRVYPRFFTYSADYPEKVLIATIKNLGQCPCPRCTVKKADIPKMGTKLDARRRENVRVDTEIRQGNVNRTREWIYEKGRPIGGVAVERVLGKESFVPTRNAFSQKLFPFGFDVFQMLVVDLLHEFELGVWKAVFTHLIRILYVIGSDAVHALDKRFRQVPTFGRDTIRRFTNNASAMKKLAGRDFEDLLQCAMPVFEGLLPAPHDAIVQDLLFSLATWHAYAKLRLHTDTTLDHFDDATTSLGTILRKFVRETCEAFNTKELPQEEAARGRRAAAKAAKKTAAGDAPSAPPPPTGLKRKILNLCTFKLHSLGDYVKMIRRFGTTDSYNTQIGELEHRRVKKFFARTNKNKFQRQIARHERRERLLRGINLRNKKAADAAQATKVRPHVNPAIAFTAADPLPYTPPAVHHHISDSVKHRLDIQTWIGDNRDDPGMQHFLPRLQDHLLGRLLDQEYDGDETEFTDEQRRTVTLVNNRLYSHKVLRINYTTYDCRRSQDSLNPRTHADIMVLSHEEGADAHPYWYGRIIGIYHMQVRHLGPESRNVETQQMDVLYVRWFGRDLSYRAGWKAKRLHRLGFLDSSDPGAFGFVNPDLVVRGAHLIPAFHHGRTAEFLPPSIVRQPSEKHEDWLYHYVSIWVDRDMFMRYRGGGVGHRVMRDWDRALGEENHVLDEPDEDNDIVMADPDGDEDEASNGNFSDPGPSEPEENDDDRGTEEEDVDEDDLEEDDEEEMGWPSWEEEVEADVDGLLGAEDGEEPYFDMIDAEGYGAL